MTWIFPSTKYADACSLLFVSLPCNIQILGERVCKGKVVSTLFIGYTLSPLTILAISLNIFESLSLIQDDEVKSDDQQCRPANHHMW